MNTKQILLVVLISFLACSQITSAGYIGDSDTVMRLGKFSISPFNYIIEQFNSTHMQSVNASGYTVKSTNVTALFDVGEGKTFFVRNGVYNITSTYLELANNTAIIGESMLDTVFLNGRLGSNLMGGMFECKNQNTSGRAYNITLKNFCVDGAYPSATSQSFGIVFENADDITLENLYMKNLWHDAIAFNTITTQRGHGSVSGSKTSNHIRINHIDGYNLGVDLIAFGTTGGSDAVINDVGCEKWGQNGTTAGRVITFCNFTDALVSNVYANKSTLGDGIVCWNSRNIEFENIIIRDAGSNGIRLSPDDITRCENLQFANVYINGSGQNGIYLGMAENCSFANVYIEHSTWSAFNVSAGQFNQYSNLKLVHNLQYGFYSEANNQYINGVYWIHNTLGEWVLPTTCLIFNSAGNKTQNWGFATDKVSGGTINHGLGVTPTSVIASGETTGVICSTRTFSATNFVVGLAWHNGTSVDADHTPQDVSWYGIYQP